jgi:23S rRNA (cytidine1920-2'-O)/16S rRNA (cytidine1409-2'-O)-methyltransferase
MARVRLDAELVRQGFFRTADDAARSVMAGDVSTSSRRLDSPGEQVRPGIELHVRGSIPYVSRGGLKLAAALDAFPVDPRGLACLDVGCSTRGFTDCLLGRGAASVLSVDVGYAQFDWSLRRDRRVELLERTNIRDVPSPERDGSIDLAVCDVSFTSVLTVLPAVMSLLSDDGAFITLVKPQFEAAHSEVGRGGVVEDASVRLACLRRVASGLADAGLGLVGACASPITGHRGNHEYLLMGARGREGVAVSDLGLEGLVAADG